MLRVSIAELERIGRLAAHGQIAPDDPLWEGLGVELDGPVTIDLDLTATAGGGILAQGTWSATILSACRRCLVDVNPALEQAVALVWVARDELASGPSNHEDDEVRELSPGADELDLREAIREEVLLSVPRFVLCEEGCLGICPHCGANRNEDDCDCTSEELDPRWDALRALKNERGD